MAEPKSELQDLLDTLLGGPPASASAPAPLGPAAITIVVRETVRQMGLSLSEARLDELAEAVIDALARE